MGHGGCRFHATRPDACRDRGAHRPLRGTDRCCSSGRLSRRAEAAVPAEGSQRLSLVDALLEGRAFDEWSLRDVAGHLRLPINGPFVVITAQAPTVGDEPLPEIESKLRSLDIFRCGGCCLMCRSGSCTSSPTTNSTGCCPTVSDDHARVGSVRPSGICATRHEPCTSQE